MKTKKPKKAIVRFEAIKQTIHVSEYQCPSCKVFYRGGLQRSTTRFICDCGQELIVELSLN